MNDSLVNLNSSVPQQNGNIANITAMFTDKIAKMNDSLNAINNVLSQKTKSIEEDEMNQKKHIDRLYDSVSNTSSHVSSIEEDWSKFKQDVKDLGAAKESTDARLSNLENARDNLMRTIEKMRGESQTQNERFTKDIGMLQQHVQRLASAQDALVSTISQKFLYYCAQYETLLE